MNISVVRHSFFRSSGGTLRYSEHSPESMDHERQICNCTRSVAEKPYGEPHHVTQKIKIDDVALDYYFEITLDEKGSPWIAFRRDDFHAYFISDVNGVKNSLSIEIILPGYGRTGCFFGRVYFGDKIDTSRFMNGHMPSGLVDLSLMTKKTVWAHYCTMGSEAMVKFRDLPETEGWRKTKEQIDRIAKAGAAYAADRISTVDGIRLQVIDDRKVMQEIFEVGTLCGVINRLKTTELFRACDEAYKISDERLKEKQR